MKGSDPDCAGTLGCFCATCRASQAEIVPRSSSQMHRIQGQKLSARKRPRNRKLRRHAPVALVRLRDREPLRCAVSLCSRRGGAPATEHLIALPGSGSSWCPGAGSNHRHCDFQSHALPTELPGRSPEPERPEGAAVYSQAIRLCPPRFIRRFGVVWPRGALLARSARHRLKDGTGRRHKSLKRI